MDREYGKVYKVEISFEKEFLSNKKEIQTFLNNNLISITFDVDEKETKVFDDEIKVICIKDDFAVLLWGVHNSEGVHDIEETLFYVLENFKYGNYKTKRMKQNDKGEIIND